ncbi:MAG: ABC-2 family transporter protein [Patescibacteria group bacterium]
MKKYFKVASLAFQEQAAYRLNFYLGLLNEFFIFSVFVLFWRKIYESGQQLGDYSFEALATYLLVMMLVNLVVRHWMANDVRQDIQEGIILPLLTKPISYVALMFAKRLGAKSAFVLWTSWLVFLAGMIVPFVTLPKNIFLWLGFAISLFFAFLTYFFIQYLAGLASFWLGNSHGLTFAIFLVTILLSGSLLPLDLFPNWLRMITDWLPFQFTAYVPISTFLGRLSPQGWFVLMGKNLLWIFGFMLFSKWLWIRGLRRYEAYGQ